LCGLSQYQFPVSSIRVIFDYQNPMLFSGEGKQPRFKVGLGDRQPVQFVFLVTAVDTTSIRARVLSGEASSAFGEGSGSGFCGKILSFPEQCREGCGSWKCQKGFLLRRRSAQRKAGPGASLCWYLL
jgi:hypothetical protein